MPILCNIVTQERTVYSGDVDYISLPGTEGVMGVLPNHAPLLTALDFGEVMVRVNGDEMFFAIGGGFAEIRPNQVIVLADSAERADDIDTERAEKARQQAEQAMKTGVSIDAERYAQIDAALRRAQIRIDVSLRRSSGLRRRRAEMPGMNVEEDQELS
jgi:F-type H+-transporting ATPase subunit epsilon